MPFTETPTIRPYKQRLMDARDLLNTQIGGTLFDGLCLLREVYEDEEFRADRQLICDIAAAAALDGEVARYGFDFRTFLNLLQAFPERRSWEEIWHHRLYETYLERLRAKQKAESSRTDRPRRSMTFAEFDAMQEQLARAEYQIKQLRPFKTEVETLRTRVAQLETENADLRRQLAETVGEPVTA